MKIQKNKLMILYLIVISCIALASGFSDAILANYFKDAYNITPTQRGFLEFPRELPGILSIFIIASLSKFNDIKITLFAQILSMIGILILAVSTPSFYTMTAILFIFSTGVHMYLPLQDSIAMSILNSDNLGKSMGKIKGISTTFSLISAIIVFIGFKLEIFSLKTDIKIVFLIAGILFFVAICFLSVLSKEIGNENIQPRRKNIIVRKKYKFYYILAIMNGVQKQIFLVYAPWVLIDLLEKDAGTMSVLIMVSSLCGMFFLPFLGRCIDRFGIRKMLYADALSYITVYLVFAYLTYNIFVGNFSKTGMAVLATFIIFIIDRMSSQMGIVRTIYLNSIVEDKSEILPTLSLGIALDHVVSIICAYLSGLVWSSYGPHYIFIIAASFSIINLVVAKVVPLKQDIKE